MNLSQQKIFSDPRGSLGVTEFLSLPFKPQRFFWIFGTPENTPRAGHGHTTCHQLLVSQQGQINIKVTAQNGNSETYTLNSGDSFHLEPMNWLELESFSPHAVLGVFASLPYDREEYIESLEDFLNLKKLD